MGTKECDDIKTCIQTSEWLQRKKSRKVFQTEEEVGVSGGGLWTGEKLGGHGTRGLMQGTL